MYTNTKIIGIEMYHPEKEVGNDVYIEHFAKRGKEVQHLMEEVCGRNKRFEIDNTGKEKEEYENSLTMQIKAAKKVLKSTNLEGKDIDAIVLASQFPEKIAPISSILIHRAIQGKKECRCIDMNANCVGMIIAFEYANSILSSDDNLQRVLVVGGDYLTITLSPDCEVMYGMFGDAACAVIVERTEEESGIVDYECEIHTQPSTSSGWPKCGISNMILGDRDIFMDLDAAKIYAQDIAEKIQVILERNKLTVNDISYFCFSQSVKSNIDSVAKYLGIEQEKYPYVGDKYGYTGGTSPFLAFNDVVKKGKVKKGDYIFFWSVATGQQYTYALYKY